MSETAAPRKLATIVALDVAGYSARTEADEARTTAEVAALRKVIETIAARHGGRVFNTAGDGFMLEFGSSLAAVEAAFELAETCEPKVRVGVHVGDVVPQPNGDLLGHGVNVAARLMARAEPGSTLISADVKRMMRGPIAERLQSCGIFKLDKMAETIEAFALIAVASAMVAAPPKTAEPLLAVLPFDNLSDDREMQFFSDGVSEEILHTIARAKGLKVIGKGSSFQFRGTDKNIRKVASELQITHILDGSVRRSGNHIRISVQLVDAHTQTTLWSDRFDRELTDVFRLQDEIAAAIANTLNTQFVPSADQRPIDPAAYDAFLRSREVLKLDATEDDLRRAATLLEQAVARAPDFAFAWAQLAYVRAMLFPRDRDRFEEQIRDAAVAAAERAISLDKDCVQAHIALATMKPAFIDYAEKLRLTEMAAALAPNDSVVLLNRGNSLNMVGRGRDGSALWERVAQLEPLSPLLLGVSALMLLTAGNVEGAIRRIEDASRRFPKSAVVRLLHYMILFHSSRYDDAELLRTTADPLSAAVSPEIANSLAFLENVRRMTKNDQVVFHNSILDRGHHSALYISYCGIAANWGHCDLAYEQLFAALETGRPLAAWNDDGRGVPRAFLASQFFAIETAALRQDQRFPILCHRLGLVDYWRSSGHWPDCAEEVPYDFKAECEKAARAM